MCEKVRQAGAFGRATIKSNLKNTCRQFQTIIGRKMDDPIVEEEQFWQLAPIVEVQLALDNSAVGEMKTNVYKCRS